MENAGSVLCQKNNAGLRIAIATVIILGTILYLTVTGIESNKSYYVTIQELQTMGNHAYTRHLRVAGNVQPGSIERDGAHLQFVLTEQGRQLRVNYAGGDPPPTPSRAMPRRLQSECMAAMASSTPLRSRRNAHPSMLPRRPRPRQNNPFPWRKKDRVNLFALNLHVQIL